MVPTLKDILSGQTYQNDLPHRNAGSNDNYDFQMIVSEDSSQTTNIAYYFYVEVG